MVASDPCVGIERVGIVIVGTIRETRFPSQADGEELTFDRPPRTAKKTPHKRFATNIHVESTLRRVFSMINVLVDRKMLWMIFN